LEPQSERAKAKEEALFRILSENSWERKLKETENIYKVETTLVLPDVDKDAKRVNRLNLRLIWDPFLRENTKQKVFRTKVNKVSGRISSLGISLLPGNGLEGLFKKKFTTKVPLFMGMEARSKQMISEVDESTVIMSQVPRKTSGVPVNGCFLEFLRAARRLASKIQVLKSRLRRNAHKEISKHHCLKRISRYLRVCFAFAKSTAVGDSAFMGKCFEVAAWTAAGIKVANSILKSDQCPPSANSTGSLQKNFRGRI